MRHAADPAGAGTYGPDAGIRPPRLAILSYSSAEFDARSARIARSATRAGFDVVVYARLQDGLPAVEERDGYRVLRARWDWWLAVPGLRTLGRRRVSASRPPATTRGKVRSRRAQPHQASSIKGRVLRVTGRLGEAVRAVLMFPILPMAWAHGLQDVVEPADIWHGMWAGSLPALVRESHRLGGRTIYDSRDVYMQSRLFANTYRPLRAVLARIERRWARRVDRVLTVNEACASLIAQQLGVRKPVVVMNCPDRWEPPDPPPDLIREALRLGPETAVVLYQGQLLTDRGIEQAMDAILDVPGSVLALLGFGPLRAELEARARRTPWAGRVFLLPAVSPDELLMWTASADVSVMPIRATSVNHVHATPQKLFESLAVGTPVVASDLPDMAEIVRAAGAGALVDPDSPASIAAGIRSILDLAPAERAALRGRVMAAAHERYTWEVQAATLLALYRDVPG